MRRRGSAYTAPPVRRPGPGPGVRQGAARPGAGLSERTWYVVRCFRNHHAACDGHGPRPRLLRGLSGAQARRVPARWQVCLCRGGQHAGAVPQAGRHQGRPHGHQFPGGRHSGHHRGAETREGGLRGLRLPGPQDREPRVCAGRREGRVVQGHRGQLPLSARGHCHIARCFKQKRPLEI